MFRARIYQPSRTAMQSGKRKTRAWLLEYERMRGIHPDGLMGWQSSGDMSAQIKLKFPTQQAAIDYCVARDIDFVVIESASHAPRLKSYADNFAYARTESWTH